MIVRLSVRIVFAAGCFHWQLEVADTKKRRTGTNLNAGAAADKKRRTNLNAAAAGAFIHFAHFANLLEAEVSSKCWGASGVGT
jgi:hypothetical protein